VPAAALGLDQPFENWSEGFASLLVIRHSLRFPSCQVNTGRA
jgi:hypothetical protein